MKQNAKKLEKSKKELKEIGIKRDEMIKKGLPAFEIENIKKNLYLHNALYHGIKLVRNLGLCGKDFPDRDFIEKLYEKHPEYKGRPIIFAPNHVRKEDAETILEAIKPHMALLSGDYENLHRNIGGPLIEKNGVIYFNMENPYQNEDLLRDKRYIEELEEYISITNSDILKEELKREKENYNKKLNNIVNDRTNIKITIRDVLNALINLLWYYEGSWCLSENKPIYDGYFEMVQTAVDTNAIVIPISYDLVKQGIFKKAVVRAGNVIDFREMYGNRKLTTKEKKEGLEVIKSEILGNLLDIWEQYSKVKRDSLVKKYGRKPSIEEDLTHDFKRESPLVAYYEKYKKNVLNGWYFTEEDIDRKHFFDKDATSKEEAFSHLDSLILNKNNAFLASKRNHN